MEEEGDCWLTRSDSPPPLLRQHQCLPVPCCSDARHAAARTEGSPDYGRAGCPPPNALQPPPPPGPSYHNCHSTRAGETSQRRRVCVCSFSQLTVLLQKRCQSTVNTVKDSVLFRPRPHSEGLQVQEPSPSLTSLNPLQHIAATSVTR